VEENKGQRGEGGEAGGGKSKHQEMLEALSSTCEDSTSRSGDPLCSLCSKDEFYRRDILDPQTDYRASQPVHHEREV
jgi:hypothetical protein